MEWGNWDRTHAAADAHTLSISGLNHVTFWLQNTSCNTCRSPSMKNLAKLSITVFIPLWYPSDDKWCRSRHYSAGSLHVTAEWAFFSPAVLKRYRGKIITSIYQNRLKVVPSTLCVVILQMTHRHLGSKIWSPLAQLNWSASSYFAVRWDIMW